MQSNFIQIAKLRHSVYHLGKNVKFSQKEIINLIENAIKVAPTPFNNQTVRAVILMGGYQGQVWQLIGQNVKQLVGSAKYQQVAAPKIHSFSQGYATVLFYTDTDIVKKTAKQVPGFPAHNFTEWSEQAQGNAQYSVWTALAEQKLGASIHHYSALFGQQVADALAKKFQVPKSWRLRTEMVLGSIEKPVQAKPLINDDQKFKVLK